MIHFVRPALIGAVCALVAACAQPAPPLPAPAPPPAPKLVPDQIDGVYRGTSTRFRADSRACPSPGLVVLRVVNGQFQYRWNGRTSVDASVGPDGMLQGSLGDIVIEGKLANHRIEGDISTANCAYHFRAVKRSH
jgi:hypothetical protein